MGNWIITIKGIGPKPPVAEVAHDFTRYLHEELKQNILSAEFVSDTPEHSANLLAERDAEAARFVPTKDGGLGYEKPAPDGQLEFTAPAPAAEPEPTEENTAPAPTAETTINPHFDAITEPEVAP